MCYLASEDLTQEELSGESKHKQLTLVFLGICSDPISFETADTIQLSAQLL